MSVILTFAMQEDPGGSGNDRLLLPDGTTISAADGATYAVTKNGTYSFTLYDVAGNQRTFRYTVTTADTSTPAVSLFSGTYRVGTTTQEPITLMLTFTTRRATSSPAAISSAPAARRAALTRPIPKQSALTNRAPITFMLTV